MLVMLATQCARCIGELRDMLQAKHNFWLKVRHFVVSSYAHDPPLAKCVSKLFCLGIESGRRSSGFVSMWLTQALSLLISHSGDKRLPGGMPSLSNNSLRSAWQQSCNSMADASASMVRAARAGRKISSDEAASADRLIRKLLDLLVVALLTSAFFRPQDTAANLALLLWGHAGRAVQTGDGCVASGSCVIDGVSGICPLINAMQNLEGVLGRVDGRLLAHLCTISNKQTGEGGARAGTKQTTAERSTYDHKLHASADIGVAGSLTMTMVVRSCIELFNKVAPEGAVVRSRCTPFDRSHLCVA